LRKKIAAIPGASNLDRRMLDSTDLRGHYEELLANDGGEIWGSTGSGRSAASLLPSTAFGYNASASGAFRLFGGEVQNCPNPK